MNMPESSYTFSDLPDNVSVGKYTSIAAHCFFHDGNDEHQYTINKKVVFSKNWDQPSYPRPISIGNDVWIGDGVRVLSEVIIGDGAIIGAGAVIAKDVPPYAVMIGNPQQIMRLRFTSSQIKELLRIKWWDWSDHMINERRVTDMLDIDTFLEKYA